MPPEEGIGVKIGPHVHSLPSGIGVLTSVLASAGLIIRRSGLPQVEHAGQIIPPTVLTGQGLVDLTHLVLFDDGIVGMEFNFRRPRPRSLGGSFT